jgi:arabinan endo-1,5-alpha-L-arabinosidase
MRTTLATLAALTLAATTLVAVPAAHAATVDPTAWYQIVSRHSGKAMDINGASTADGAGLVQWARLSQSNQQFQFVDAGGGYYRIRARHSGKVIEVAGAQDGANTYQFTDNGNTRQHFRLADSSGGYVRFINRSSNKALDVWEWSTADGGRISQFTDTGGANQQWQLTPVTSYPNPGAVTGDTGAHDPSVVRAANGTYILPYTGNNLPIKTSTDRITWRNAGAVWPNGAPWTTTYTNGSRALWAPDISFHNGQFYLYYSASTFGSQRSAIFLATSSTGAAGSWTDRGLVIESSSAVNYNAIDPNLVVDAAGQWWLTFGSFWTGIKLIRLDSATGKRSTSDTSVRALAQRTTASGAIEAPFVYQRGGFYYLFVSFDVCCRGAQSTYRVMVGRSSSVTGPYVDRAGVAMTSGGGTEILATHGSIHGPGHQAVLADVLFYHYYADSGASFLGINPLAWDAAGWPIVMP